MSLATLSRTPAFTDERQYRLIRAATFPLFLLAAASRRTWRNARGTAGDHPRSVFAEARAASANALLFAFQG